MYYTTEKPLPMEAKQACRLVLATTESQREAVQTVLEEFFEQTDAGWINRRADGEIEAMREKQQKQREKAQKMWAARKAAMPTTDSGSASAMPRHTQDDAAASNGDADAMPPTPTPTPTPTPIIKDIGAVAPFAKTRKRQLPEDFALSDTGMRTALAAGLDVEAEVARFRDHHTAKGSVMADWQAAWRTWVGHAVQFGRGGKAKPAQAEWAKTAGFESVYEAENAGCRQHNAAQFRDGKKIKEAA